MKEFLKRTLLVLGSLAVGFLLVEGFLRVTRPDLKFAAESKYQPYASRLFWNPKNMSYFRRHPDSGRRFLVMHNNLGMRQHRSFTIKKQEGVLRIGFFGDSYLANLRMPAQYSFTEPLDYLCNRFLKQPVEILNFGVGGYSTDQIYLTYLEEGNHLDLDIVVYFFCQNDVLGILDNDITIEKPDGTVEFKTVRSPLWKRLLRSFYLTYIIRSALKNFYNENARLRPVSNKENMLLQKVQLIERDVYIDSLIKKNQIDPDFERAKRLFSKILMAWRNDTIKNKQLFLIGVVPKHQRTAEAVFPIIEQLDIPIISMFSEFKVLQHDSERFFFKNDGHWNEEGNKHAVVYFFKKFWKLLGYPEVSDEMIAQALYEYYSSFPGYHKIISDSWIKQTDISFEENERIRLKYLMLE